MKDKSGERKFISNEDNNREDFLIIILNLKSMVKNNNVLSVKKLRSYIKTLRSINLTGLDILNFFQELQNLHKKGLVEKFIWIKSLSSLLSKLEHSEEKIVEKLGGIIYTLSLHNYIRPNVLWETLAQHVPIKTGLRPYLERKSSELALEDTAIHTKGSNKRKVSVEDVENIQITVTYDGEQQRPSKIQRSADSVDISLYRNDTLKLETSVPCVMGHLSFNYSFFNVKNMRVEREIKEQNLTAAKPEPVIPSDHIEEKFDGLQEKSMIKNGKKVVASDYFNTPFDFHFYPHHDLKSSDRNEVENLEFQFS